MERLGGYKIVDDYKFVSEPKAGTHCKAIISDGNIRYIFKEGNELQSYHELFYSRILKILELPTVEYDLAVRYKTFGVISPYFEHDEKENYSFSEILGSYTNETDNKNIYSYEEIKPILAWYFQIKGWKYTDRINEGLLNQFIIQILLGNMDLNASNMELYVENEEVKWFPFYDFDSCGRANLKDRLYSYKLRYAHTISDEVIPTSRTLKTFLKYSDRENIEKFKNYLECMKKINTTSILEKIKEQTEADIPKDIKRQLQREVKTNLRNIDSILKRKIH